MFIVFKKRRIIAIFFLVLLHLVPFFAVPVFAIQASSPKLTKTIVIDAGHGGRDGGCVGGSGVTESELTLQYAKKLEEILENVGFSVVLTRKNMDGLYDLTSSNKKMSDMKKRQEIVEDANADLVISLHMNSLKLDYVNGVQVYHQIDDEISQVFAQKITNSFEKDIIEILAKERKGDFFILNTSDCPSILIECGFLSNIQEEKLLCSEDYCEKICNSIAKGVIEFLA